MADETLSKEQLLRLARQMKVRPLPFIKWGCTDADQEFSFRLDGKPMLHSQWIARADETAGCYLRFRGSKLLERTETVVLKYSGRPIRPDKLRDRSRWDKSKYSEFPQDPYLLDLTVPLQNVESGLKVLFSTHAEWGRNAILELFEHWAKTDRRPIVQLEKQKISTGGGEKYIIAGALNIVDQDENAISDEDVVDLSRDEIINEPPRDEPTGRASNGANDPISTGNGVSQSRRDDLDDDIPF